MAQALTQLGVQVWYAEFSLEPGANLSRSIDKGLAGSKFGLVIVSKAFISKKWPERELQGLVANQIAGQTLIIPIWLDVSQQEVLDYSPPLVSLSKRTSPEGRVRCVLGVFVSIIWSPWV